MSSHLHYMESAESWLNSLDSVKLKAVAKMLRLVEMCGHTLRLPHSKALGAGLFELRDKQYGLRMYYCFDLDEHIVLLNGGDKGTQVRDIKLARKQLSLIRRGCYEKEKL